MKTGYAQLDNLLTSVLGTGSITATAGTGGNGFAQYTIPDYGMAKNVPNTIGYMQQLTNEWQERPSKVEQAFKVMSKLKEMSLINIHSVEDFIKTVLEVSKVL